MTAINQTPIEPQLRSQTFFWLLGFKANRVYELGVWEYSFLHDLMPIVCLFDVFSENSGVRLPKRHWLKDFGIPNAISLSVFCCKIDSTEQERGVI
jgi:hypothetical protein